MIERIAEIKAELLFIERHKRILDEEKETLNQLAIEKNNKEKILLKENKDVDNLEEMSLKSLFHFILGNKEQQLEKEKQEAMKASIEYQRTLNDYNNKVEDVRRLKERLEKEESLLLELEELQLKVNNDNKEILEYRNKIILNQSRLKEIEEAVQSGQSAVAGLESVKTFLDKANNWGTLDMLGGDFFSAMMKHDNYEKAQSYLSIAKNKIYRFKKELKDVYIENVDIPSFDMSDYVLDFVFDNIFTDMVIQSKISDNLKKVNHTICTIEEILEGLYEEKRKILDHQKVISQSLKELLQRL